MEIIIHLEKNYDRLLVEMNERLNKKWELSINIKEIKETVSKYSKITDAVIYDSIMRSFLRISQQLWRFVGETEPH